VSPVLEIDPVVGVGQETGVGRGQSQDQNQGQIPRLGLPHSTKERKVLNKS